jgi:hypothetical protein
MEQEQIAQKIMSEIHRLVQKLKDGGMNVDSTVETVTTLVDDTVKYTDKLTLTGNFERVRFDTRTPEEVKAELLQEKQAFELKVQESISKLDEKIAVVDVAKN